MKNISLFLFLAIISSNYVIFLNKAFAFQMVASFKWYLILWNIFLSNTLKNMIKAFEGRMGEGYVTNPTYCPVCYKNAHFKGSCTALILLVHDNYVITCNPLFCEAIYYKNRYTIVWFVTLTDVHVNPWETYSNWNFNLTFLPLEEFIYFGFSSTKNQLATP